MIQSQKTIKKKTPVIAMCHISALPGEPHFDERSGVSGVVERVGTDLDALQRADVDAVLFSNEFSMPYRLSADMVTVAGMAEVIGELKSQITVPFGVDYMFDAKASVDLAAVTGASFIRCVASGAYSSDFGIWNTDAGEVARHIYNRRIEKNLKVFYSIVPQGSVALAERELKENLRTVQQHINPDAICRHSSILSKLINSGKIGTILKEKKYALIVDGGCNQENICEIVPWVDGVIVGSALKVSGVFEKEIDPERVVKFMKTIRAVSR